MLATRERIQLAHPKNHRTTAPYLPLRRRHISGLLSSDRMGLPTSEVKKDHHLLLLAKSSCRRAHQVQRIQGTTPMPAYLAIHSLSILRSPCSSSQRRNATSFQPGRERERERRLLWYKSLARMPRDSTNAPRNSASLQRSPALLPSKPNPQQDAVLQQALHPRRRLRRGRRCRPRHGARWLVPSGGCAGLATSMLMLIMPATDSVIIAPCSCSGKTCSCSESTRSDIPGG
ncbi:hypothetical protein C2E23DRAFT_841453 [Lenzites betulinus]|nr:hypothetical protein C2E23DRAFT_841453 [Lenzites betulinus]